MSNRILVVLPTLGDRIDTLEKTLESVDAQRRHVELKLVVIVPSGADAARELSRRFGALIIDDPRLGISHAINLGVRAATDERFYAWIGDDDLFRPRGLLTLRTMLAAKPQAVLAYGACDYIDGEDRLIFTNRAGRLAQFLLPWGPDLIPHPGSLILLDAIREVGLFDTSLKYAMDLDLFLKIRRIGPFVCTKESVSAFRWHSQSLTVAGRAASTREAADIKRRHLPNAVRPFAPLWELPVGAAAALAAASVSRRAKLAAVRNSQAFALGQDRS